MFSCSLGTRVFLCRHDQEPLKDQLVNLLIQTHRLRQSETRRGSMSVCGKTNRDAI